MAGGVPLTDELTIGLNIINNENRFHRFSPSSSFESREQSLEVAVENGFDEDCTEAECAELTGPLPF